MHTATQPIVWPGRLYPADTPDAAAIYLLQARSLVVLMERRKNGKKEEPNEAAS
jgi:hypothetical protein